MDAAEAGDVATMKSMLDNGSSDGIEHDTLPMDEAACHGHLEAVIWLHTHCDGGCTTDAMDMAATNRHFDVVKWLTENRDEGCTNDAFVRLGGCDELGQRIWAWLRRYRPADEFRNADGSFFPISAYEESSTDSEDV